MRALLLTLILLLATAINCYASNSVYIKQTDQTGSSIFIKQDGSSNVVGVSSSVPLLIQGNNVDIIIKQIGNSNDDVQITASLLNLSNRMNKRDTKYPSFGIVGSPCN